MVDGSAAEAALIERALAPRRRVEVTLSSDDEVRRALRRGDLPDLIVCVCSGPATRVCDTLHVLRELDLDVPLIVLADARGQDAAISAMAAGAHDYVRMDDLARLAPAVDRELREREERRARRRAETRYRILFERSPLPKWIFDLETLRIVEVNAAAERLYGYTRDELLAMTVKELRPPEEVPRLLEHLAKRSEVVGMTWRHRKKDGTVFDAAVSASEVPDGDHRQQLVVIQDVTERKRLEDELRHAQKMEAVGRLAGGVAHDFNNLLSVILSYGEIVRDELLERDPLRADIDEICRAARRGADLVRQLLLFSRQQVVEPRVLDVNELLGGMERMIERLVGEDIGVALVRAPKLGNVCVDPGSLEQVIMNLVVNARDAMPTGGKLTIETADVVLDEAYARRHPNNARAGAHVMLAVSDNGVGMDAATRGHIFEPFFTTKEPGKGTGLGLSTVFGIVQQAGGSIGVYSETGHGSTFKVYLPRVDAAAQHAHDTSDAPDAGSETILLVEDDEQLRTVTAEILRRRGYRVLEARSGSEATRLARGEGGAIDLLLTDVVMPEMSGPALAAELQRDRPATKVLFMSGYTDDSIVRHGVLEARMAYLQKPFTPHRLTRKVRGVLDAPATR